MAILTNAVTDRTRRRARIPRRDGLIATSVRAGAIALACALSFAAAAQPEDVPGHAAALLYETHCRSCHDAQVHWRDNHRVRDYAGLVREVERWQRNQSLGWTDLEVRQVAHYLNLRYYRFAPPPPKVIVRR